MPTQLEARHHKSPRRLRRKRRPRHFPGCTRTLKTAKQELSISIRLASVVLPVRLMCFEDSPCAFGTMLPQAKAANRRTHLVVRVKGGLVLAARSSGSASKRPFHAFSLVAVGGNARVPGSTAELPGRRDNTTPRSTRHHPLRRSTRLWGYPVP